MAVEAASESEGCIERDGERRERKERGVEGGRDGERREGRREEWREGEMEREKRRKERGVEGGRDGEKWREGEMEREAEIALPSGARRWGN